MKKSKLIVTSVLLIVILAATLIAFTACDETPGYLPEETLIYSVDSNTSAFNMPIGLLLDANKSYIEFSKEGIMTVYLSIDVETILKGLGSFGVDLETIDLSAVTKSSIQVGYIEGYLNVLFPGFTLTDVEGSLALIKNSVGVEFIGLDFENNANLAALRDQIELVPDADGDGIAENDAIFPDNFSLSELPAEIALQIKAPYKLRDFTAEDGTQYVGALVGSYPSETLPFMVWTKYTNSLNKEKIHFHNEMLPLDIYGTLRTASVEE